MKTIDREEWHKLNVEFGQMEEPLGHPRVQLTKSGLQAEFGDAESSVSVWAAPKSTRIDAGKLTILVSQERLMLLKAVGPYPTQGWDVLYDSAPEPELTTHGSQTDPWGTTWTASDINDPAFGQVTVEKAAQLAQLVQLLRLAVQGYYGGQVDETDPAVPLVQSMLERYRSVRLPAVSLTERAVQIVRTVRSMVPR